MGETGYPVFETEIGKVGMFICADARIPEGARALTLKGAEILLHITNSTTHEQHLIHVPTRGNENEVYIVSADKAGREKGLTYPGNSLIISPDGTVQAQGSQFDEEIVYGEVDLATLKAMRERKDGILNGRRPETYGLLAEEYDRLPIAKIIDSPVVPSHLAVLAAVQQVTNVDGDAQATLERALAVGYEAAKENARLIVFPELFLCGLDPSPEEAGRSAALTARAIEGFANHARQWNASYALSLVTEDAGKLHQSVHLVGPDEARSRRYDKVHLSEEEARWATPGTAYVVAEMPFGNVGLMAGTRGALLRGGAHPHLHGGRCHRRTVVLARRTREEAFPARTRPREQEFHRRRQPPRRPRRRRQRHRAAQRRRHVDLRGGPGGLLLRLPQPGVGAGQADPARHRPH